MKALLPCLTIIILAPTSTILALDGFEVSDILEEAADIQKQRDDVNQHRRRLLSSSVNHYDGKRLEEQSCLTNCINDCSFLDESKCQLECVVFCSSKNKHRADTTDSSQSRPPKKQHLRRRLSKTEPSFKSKTEMVTEVCRKECLEDDMHGRHDCSQAKDEILCLYCDQLCPILKERYNTIR